MTEQPDIEGYELLRLIGKGSSGEVFEATDAEGRICAVKVLDSMSSNASLLADRIGRVRGGKFETKILPILNVSLSGRPSYIVTELMGIWENDTFRSSHLQSRFTELREEDPWAVVIQLAESIAELHSVRVPHGNLKPSNVFFSSDDELLLADFTCGLMPNVQHIEFTDALLYTAPEQLRDPAGYLEEKGYRWDVFAFGVLAYRMVTGQFPRCEEYFSEVCPITGNKDRFSIEADLEGIAESLESGAEVRWPEEPADERENHLRAMIESCLAICPEDRPIDLIEVTRYFSDLDEVLAAEKERAGLISLANRAVKGKRRARNLATVTALVAAVLGGGWAVTEQFRQKESRAAADALEEEKQGQADFIEALKSRRDVAIGAEEKAKAERREAVALLDSSQSRGDEDLAAAQAINEVLFRWALERGVKGVPILEGRNERLTDLRSKVEGQLEMLAGRPALAGQADLLGLRRAEILLALGLLEEGEAALSEVISLGRLEPGLLAQARLRHLLLVSERDPAGIEVALEAHEAEIISALEGDETQALVVQGAIALMKGRLAEKKEAFEEALRHYGESLGYFRELEEKFPEAPAIALTIGRTYLASARAAEGEGSLTDAARLRSDAITAFTELAGKEKEPAPELRYAIAAAEAEKAVAAWDQGKTFEAEKLARQGLIALRKLEKEMPDNQALKVDLASQNGLIAIALRDEGKSKEAKRILSRSVAELTEVIEAEPRNWKARYLLASLQWQLSGVLGAVGESESELTVGAQAVAGLQEILAAKVKKPAPSAVRRSLAYLCGDLGNIADLKDQRELAIQYLKRSKRYWQELARDEGDQLEFRKGYHWAVQKLAEMGVRD